MTNREMNKFGIFTAFVLCSFCCDLSSQAKMVESLMDNSKVRNSGNAMDNCNSTYNIKQEYLQELNDTGSFPDESEKTPMCFIKCYLETSGLINSEGKVNKEKVVSVYQIDNDDMVDDCSKEMTSSSITDNCEKAYFFIRCIMTRSLLEHLDSDSEDDN